MQCTRHPDSTATAFCTHCGAALCEQCIESRDPRILCPKCSESLPHAQASTSDSTSVPPPITPPLPAIPSTVPNSVTAYPYCSPAVSFVLGLIPGVGAVSNGDYFKGFFQVLVFGSLVALSDSSEVGAFSSFFVFLSVVYYVYMPLQAYHVAKKRLLALQGIEVLTPLERLPFSDLIGGILAIGAGTLFLVNQFVPGTLALVAKGWPLALIALGIFNLVRHFRS
ncbi:MAG: B-box zinc finger protein [Acidobacteriota bacterium]